MSLRTALPNSEPACRNVARSGRETAEVAHRRDLLENGRAQPRWKLLSPTACAERLLRPKLLFNFVSLLISTIAFIAPQAHGQAYTGPFCSTSKIYGTILLSGNGAPSSNGATYTTDQRIGIGVDLPDLIYDSCDHLSTSSNAMLVYVHVDDVNSNAGGSQTCLVDAPGSANTSATFYLLGDGYTFAMEGDATEECTTVWDGGSMTQSVPLAWGAAGGVSGASPMDPRQLPLQSGASTVGGSQSFLTNPADSPLDIPWRLTWNFSVAPDTKCKDCPDDRGSELSLQSQSLGENIAIVGTPFYLHYGSDRAAGHAGADAVAIADAQSLGGWTLNVHHAMEPLLLGWCVGGLCTPYAIVPKALFLGDGSTRDDSDVQAPISANGKLYLTSEDGSEVFEFQNYVHTRTLRPMTGAVLYSFAYDAGGQLVKVTDASGNVTTIRRDANEHPTAIVSPYGQTTTLKTDSNDYLSEVTDPAGHTIKLTCGSTGLLATLTDSNGNNYKFDYDDYGRVLNDSDSAGGSLTLSRADTNNGDIVTETTALGVTSKFQTAFSNAGGVSTTQQYTNTWPSGLAATDTDVQGLGQIEEITTLPDGTSQTSTLAPDPRWGIQVPITAAETLKQGTLTMKIANTRDAQVGNGGNPFDLTSQTDQETINGRTYITVFTGSDRTYVDTTPMGRKMMTVLDSKERISSWQAEGLLAANFTYDARGRLSKVTQGTRTTSYSYNNDGFLASVTDPLKLVTKFDYDADGRPLSTILPDGRVIGFSYDANGNPTSVTPPGKSAHKMDYTEVNLLAGYIPPALAGAGPTTYTNNADRDLTKVTRPDEKTIEFGYDTAGRLSSVTTPTETIDYTYDPKTGNLDSEKGTNGESLKYEYNGPLPTSTQWAGTISGTVDAAYNDNIWITSESVNGGETIEFTYDKDGFATKAGDMTLELSAENGLLLGTTLDRASDAFTYNSFGELTGYAALYAGKNLYHVIYDRDADGRVAGKTETFAGKTSGYAYTYDPSGRLIEVAENGKTASTYTYDSNSNRLKAATASGTASGTYDAQDRLLTYGKSIFAYTANGELESEKTGTQMTNYVYDVLGNLTGVTLPDGKLIAYVVDAENRRVGKKVNGELMEGFLYDGSRIVAQLDSSNKIVSRFVYATGNTSPDYMIAGTETYRIFSDQLGSPRVIVNVATGAIAEEITYDEFGNVISDSKPGFQPFGFAGGLYDQDTKLARFGARDYDPHSGRWTAKDPILFRGGDANLYGYVLNDPVNLLDPAGLQGVDCACSMPKKSEPSKAIPFVNYTPGVEEINAMLQAILQKLPPGPASATPAERSDPGSVSAWPWELPNYNPRSKLPGPMDCWKKLKEMGKIQPKNSPQPGDFEPGGPSNPQGPSPVGGPPSDPEIDVGPIESTEPPAVP
jgi:RHS repeat-associated protein